MCLCYVSGFCLWSVELCLFVCWFVSCVPLLCGVWLCFVFGVCYVMCCVIGLLIMCCMGVVAVVVVVWCCGCCGVVGVVVCV